MPEESRNKELFSKHGMKNTRQRNLIIEILRASSEPLTADRIFMKIKDTDEEISLSTIYRILELFTAKGLALKSSLAGDTKAVYELKLPSHRHHLICVGCKRMISIEGCPLENYEIMLQDRNGFDITGHKLEIYGICPNCKDIRK